MNRVRSARREVLCAALATLAAVTLLWTSAAAAQSEYGKSAGGNSVYFGVVPASSFAATIPRLKRGRK